jgi:hypothetical protein
MKTNKKITLKIDPIKLVNISFFVQSPTGHGGPAFKFLIEITRSPNELTKIKVMPIPIIVVAIIAHGIKYFDLITLIFFVLRLTSPQITAIIIHKKEKAAAHCPIISTNESVPAICVGSRSFIVSDGFEPLLYINSPVTLHINLYLLMSQKK